MPTVQTVSFARRLIVKAFFPAFLGPSMLVACGGGSTEPPPVSAQERKVFVAPGVELHARDWNVSANSLTFVLLAGLGGNASGFDSLARAMAQRMQARVVAITRRGYGLSDKPRPSPTGQEYDPATLVSDIRTVLDSLAIERAVLVGHSIAGNELSLFATLHPHRTRGLVYLDTTYDYSRAVPEKPSDIGLNDNPMLQEPSPNETDYTSLESAIAFSRRTSKNWAAPLERQLRDSLVVLQDGSVRLNTPGSVAEAMVTSAKGFSPDYAKVRAPALVVSAYPSTLRDLFPWLTQSEEATTLTDGDAMLALIRKARASEEALFKRALPGSTVLRVEHSSHADFFIEHEAIIVQALEAIQWGR